MDGKGNMKRWIRLKTTSDTHQLTKEFPEIPEEKANEINIEIKKRIIAYQPTGINEDISRQIQLITKKYVISKNANRVKKKCNRLAAYYLKSDMRWNMQENWFCLLAYFIMIVTMVSRVLELETWTNDRLSLGMYFIALIVWRLIEKNHRLMGRKAEMLLNAFNKQAPSMIFISSLMFYYVIILSHNKVIWITEIGVSIIFTGWVTILWYQRIKEV